MEETFDSTDWQAAHADLLAAYVALLKGQDGLIPEMVWGDRLAQVQANTEIARQAYTRLAAQVAAQVASAASPVSPTAQPPLPPEQTPSAPPFLMGAGGGSRSSGLTGGIEQQQGKRPDPTALIAQYYSSGLARR